MLPTTVRTTRKTNIKSKSEWCDICAQKKNIQNCIALSRIIQTVLFVLGRSGRAFCLLYLLRQEFVHVDKVLEDLIVKPRHCLVKIASFVCISVMTHFVTFSIASMLKDTGSVFRWGFCCNLVKQFGAELLL